MVVLLRVARLYAIAISALSAAALSLSFLSIMALIVLGSHGQSALYDLLVGSVSEGVVRASKVPVLLVPARR